jgi:hypothetical protein
MEEPRNEMRVFPGIEISIADASFIDIGSADDDDGRHRRVILPDSLTRLLVDYQVAEGMRLVVERVHKAAGNLEIAFLLWGKPPTAKRAARVTDFQPADSRSTGGSVEVSPQAMHNAQVRLMKRHPGSPSHVLGIAHSHPDSTYPRRSMVDQRWHSECLDMHYRDELVVALPPSHVWAGRDPLALQTFFSVVLPHTGRIAKSTGYLLARPDGWEGCRDLEHEITLTITETAAAERTAARLKPRIWGRKPWKATITYGRRRSREEPRPVEHPAEN